MRVIGILIVLYFILLAANSGVLGSEDDYLAVFGPGGKLGAPDYYNYTPAFAEFMARDYLPGSITPVYLGRSLPRKPVLIGGFVPVFANLAGARWSPVWPYNESHTARQSGHFFPDYDPLNIEEYYVPSLVEFLKPDYKPEGINYSLHVPALGNFANASWQPPGTNYSLYVPELGAFLSEDWMSPSPNPADYPPWMIAYLNG